MKRWTTVFEVLTVVAFFVGGTAMFTELTSNGKMLSTIKNDIGDIRLSMSTMQNVVTSLASKQNLLDHEVAALKRTQGNNTK